MFTVDRLKKSRSNTFIRYIIAVYYTAVQHRRRFVFLSRFIAYTHTQHYYNNVVRTTFDPDRD